jgi:hypothetical protein
MIPEKEWEWFGFKKHFIGAKDCGFSLATKIGDVIVSTVGDYRPYDKFFKKDGTLFKEVSALADFAKKGPQEIGHDRFFETMTFKAVPATCDCCDWEIDPFSDGDIEGGFGAYKTAAEARKGHIEICYEIAKRG